LTFTRNQPAFRPQRSPRTSATALALLVAVAPFVVAQGVVAQPPAATTSSINLAASSLPVGLPDSPGSLISSSIPAAGMHATDVDSTQMDATSTSAGPDNLDNLDDPQQPTPPPSPPPPNARTKYSAHFAMTIAPNEIAKPLPVRDKIVGGLADSVSLFAATGWLASAGWSHWTNGSPNYGTDKGAFGERLGAAALRNISQDIFSDCLFAPIFHEDPRYYIMGRKHNFLKRVVYAGTRAIVGRTDSGRTIPNFSLLAGDAAGAALTVTYYPAQNTSFKEVAETFGGSVGGSALGYVVTEFIGDALQYAHLRKKD
jgi:hypothetical protein